MAAYEQSKQRARRAGAQHDLKAVEMLPAQGSTAALAEAGVAQPVSQQGTINDSDSSALPESRPLPEPPPQSERASEVGKSNALSTTLRSPATDCNSDSGRGADTHARQSQPPAALQQDRSASAKVTSTLAMDVEYFTPARPPAVSDHVHQPHRLAGRRRLCLG